MIAGNGQGAIVKARRRCNVQAEVTDRPKRSVSVEADGALMAREYQFA